jgi:hypothetical protein
MVMMRSKTPLARIQNTERREAWRGTWRTCHLPALVCALVMVAALALPLSVFPAKAAAAGGAPTVTSINPNSGVQGATVNVTDLLGTNFQATPRVLLHTAGQADISATNVIAVSATKVDCSFAIPLDAAVGAWDVYVANPDGQIGVLPDAFTIGKGAALQWFFAEGTTRPGFETYFTIQNPGGEEAEVILTYLTGKGTSKQQGVIVQPNARATVRASDALGAGNSSAYDFSTVITCSNDQQIVAERPMYFDYRGSGTVSWDGGSDVLGATGPSKQWDFAEGTCRPGFDTYFCLENPTSLTANVTLSYMKGDGTSATDTVAIKKYSRATVVPRNKLGTGEDAAHDFSTRVTSDQQIVAERPMYFNYHGAWTGGHDVVGATAEASTFYFAEGTCRPGFDPYFCIQNPGAAPATVTLKYMKGDGTTASESVTVGPNSRSTVSPRAKLGTGSDAAHDFSTELTSDQPVVAERPMYFNYRGAWTGGSNVMGATSPSSIFYFAEGTCRPGFAPYITVENPGTAAADVQLAYMKGNGTVARQVITVGPNSRATVDPATILGSADDAAHDFSTMVTSSVPIVAERPMYFSYRGVWTGGSCVIGYGPYFMVGGAMTLDGIPLPAYSGLVGREQHLCLTMSQEPPATHYAISGTPAAAQNGMAWQEEGGSGYGAWGKAPPVQDERYYVNMRWNYTDMHGQQILASKDWYYRKKLLVINPANGKRVIASIVEYGPALWTGRVSGLSPEAMLVLGASTDDNLTYYWALDQNLPLGPI